MTTSCVTDISTGPICTEPSKRLKLGNARMPEPKKPRAVYCRKRDAPMAVMSGTSRGAPRSGRYAIRSSSTAMTMLTIIAVARVRAKARMGLESIMPWLFRPVAVNQALKAPHMKTSPWAKLIMNRMP